MHEQLFWHKGSNVELTQPVATRRSATGISTGKLAVWWVLASEIVIFGGLLACYVLFRLMYAHWGEDASHTKTWFGAANTVVLLTSSLFAVLAHHAAEHEKNGVKAARFLWYTVLGAVAFLVIKGVEWSQEIAQGYTITKSLFWSFYYAAAGLHAAHVIVGAIIMIMVARQARQGENLQRVELIGIYWHFVDIIWIFLFPMLYIAK